MLTRIGRLLLQLHRDSRQQTVADFPRWAMAQVATTIPFDSSFWGSGCQIDGEVVTHSWWLHNLPMQSIEDWERIKHRDTVAPLLIAAPGKVVNLASPELRDQHAFTYHEFYCHYGVEQFLGTYVPNTATGIYDAISIYRSDAARPFSEEERQAFECLVPNLIETRRANYLNHTSLVSGAGERAPIYYRAAADDKGILHAAEEGFAQLLADEWPDRQGPRLPASLIASLKKRRGHHLGTHIAIDFHRPLDLTLLYARRRQLIDDLSPRQAEIAHAFANGQSHKEIAQSFDLSPATVRNHIGAIYKTLRIGSKAELASQLTRHATPLR